MTATVNSRFALLQEVQRRCGHGGYLSECFGRSFGLVALGSVLVPMIGSQSSAWEQRIAGMTLLDWFELLAHDHAYDRFKYGALARSALALGLVIGDQSKRGGMAVVVEAVRPPKAEGVTQAVWSRLKGMNNAPKDPLVADFSGWVDGQGENALAGATVKISEQSVEHVCQWVDAVNDSELDAVVDGSVWSAIMAQLNDATG